MVVAATHFSYLIRKPPTSTLNIPLLWPSCCYHIFFVKIFLSVFSVCVCVKLVIYSSRVGQFFKYVLWFSMKCIRIQRKKKDIHFNNVSNANGNIVPYIYAWTSIRMALVYNNIPSGRIFSESFINRSKLSRGCLLKGKLQYRIPNFFYSRIRFAFFFFISFSHCFAQNI